MSERNDAIEECAAKLDRMANLYGEYHKREQGRAERGERHTPLFARDEETLRDAARELRAMKDKADG